MIGKTRQSGKAGNSSLPEDGAGKSRGVLRQKRELQDFVVSRSFPLPALADFIQHYWAVSWDLSDRAPHLQETLPHPNAYLVFEEGKLTVSGVTTRKFSRLLQGRSSVFGVKFKPGGLRPFLDSPVSTLTDQIIPANRIFGEAADALESRLLAVTTEVQRVDAASGFFQERIPPPDEMVRLATRLVEQILTEPEIKAVEDLASRSGLGIRSLQRLFSEYVGISPKWVIRRYRLHELVDRLNSGEDFNWPDLALELGYFDQAHLINDFRSIVGQPPDHYRKLDRPTS